MSNIVSKLVGGGIIDGVSDVVNAVGDQLNRKNVLQADLIKTEIQADSAVAVAQNNVNGVQAASSDKFTSRMRPMGGYLCMFVIGYNGILQPFIVLISKMCHNTVDMPTMDATLLVTCGTIWTGLNGLRSFDKLKGTASSWVDPDK